MPFSYSFDQTGQDPANKVTGETHIITAVNHPDFHLIVPTFGPFFANDSFKAFYREAGGTSRPLVEGVDFHFGHDFIEARESLKLPVSASIVLLNRDLAGEITTNYQALGDKWTISPLAIQQALIDKLRNPRVVSYEQIANLPERFPVINHPLNIEDVHGMAEIRDMILKVAEAITNKTVSGSGTPFNLEVRPFTKKSIGLGSVVNAGFSSDEASKLGEANNLYLNPRGGRLLAERVVGQFFDKYLKDIYSPTPPTAGDWSTGQYVYCSNPTIKDFPPSHPMYGVKYRVRGWKRLTNGSTHVLEVDWMTDPMILI